MSTLPNGVVNQFSPEMLAAASKLANQLDKGRRVAEMGRVFGVDQHSWKDLNAFKRTYFEKNPKTVFELCRKLRKQHGWLDRFLAVKTHYVLHGFRWMSPEGRALAEANVGYDFKRILEDVMLELTTCDNAVAQWPTTAAGKTNAGLPWVSILNCEQVEYKDEDGAERVKPDKSAAKEPKKKDGSVQTVQTGAYGEDKDGWIVLGEEKDEKFEVYSSGKRGGGYGVPSLYGLIFDLGLIEILQTGDFNAALMTRDVMRQIKKGHEISYGPLAGQPVYFLKRGDIKTITEALAAKIGAFDFLTNFDVDITFPTLDTKYFDKDKYAATWARILEWMGPLGRYQTATNGEAAAAALAAFRVEVDEIRDRLARFAGRIFNDGTFSKRAADSGKIKIGFHPFTCYSTKERREMMSWATQNGYLSPQTAREFLGLEDELERERLREAAAAPDEFRPVFEPKQGLLMTEVSGDGSSSSSGTGGTGGRPEDSTNREVEE